ncbi:hypothetical protein KKE92_05650 [Candidatus Micrarchaeota archaeon]|nr:hypothetical protein [Candidatus Micrarchaeota archaeon]MBU1681244.1 hypothetical protein [Candidatus Micrarchaeota archaeon]
MVKPRVENESKSDKFKRIATMRTRKIIDAIRLLGNCSNTSTYGYTDEDVKAIYNAIEKEIKRTKVLFQKKVDDDFSL